MFEGKPKVDDLRAIANLYPESIHLVARKGAGIKTPADLKGKRVSLDEPGSGTLVDARIILAAYGVSEKDVKAEYLKPNQAGDKLRDDGLDAFFFVGGYPAGAISELASSGGGIEIVPIDGPQADKIRAEYKFFAADNIPAETYKNVGCGQDPVGGRAVGDVVEDQQRPRLQRDQGPVGRQDPRGARCRPRQGQVHPQGDGAERRGHSAAPGRREVL